ncbi:MAG: hypothetical protein ACI395_10415 [Candidatus Cryptobacteroides sp.]
MGEIFRRVLTLIAVLEGCCVLAAGCYGPVESGRDFPLRDPAAGAEGEDNPASDSGVKWKSLYVTGVEYPPGFPWRYHIGTPPKGTVLFLMKDGRRIVELEVDEAGEIGAEADMHRCIDGHLYTDYSSATETVLKKDGEELFRFQGREMIASMLVTNGDVHILSVPRSGSGWVYRKNGEVLLYKSVGALMPYGLHLDGDSVCFAYEDRVPSSSGDVLKYFYVTDGVAKSVDVPDDVVTVEDVLVTGGEVLHIAFRKNIRPAVLAKGLDGRAYDLSLNETMSGCRFFEDKGEIFTFAYARVGESETAGFWKMTERVASYHPSLEAVAWDSDGTDVYAVCAERGAGEASFYKNSGSLNFGTGCCSFYPGTVAVCDGRYCVATARIKDLKPALWMDGGLTEYDFNGVFTSVSWW